MSRKEPGSGYREKKEMDISSDVKHSDSQIQEMGSSSCDV